MLSRAAVVLSRSRVSALLLRRSRVHKLPLVLCSQSILVEGSILRKSTTDNGRIFFSVGAFDREALQSDEYLESDEFLESEELSFEDDDIERNEEMEIDVSSREESGVGSLDDKSTSAEAGPPPPRKRRRPRFKSRQLPTITTEAGVEFFEEVAPLLSVKQIKSFTTKLKTKRAKTSRLTTRIQSMWKASGKNKRIVLPQWLRIKFTNFIVGREGDASFSEEYLDHYAPHANRRNWEQNLATLERARDLAVGNPLLWSRKEKKSIHKDYNQRNPASSKNKGGKKKLTLEDIRADRASHLLKIHQAKSPEKLAEETESIANLLADSLPAGAHDKWMDMLQANVDTCRVSDNDDDNDGKDSKANNPRRMRLLLPNLYNATKSHVHLVAQEVADYFYVDMPVVEPSDSRMVLSQERWLEMQDAFSEAAVYFHESLAELQADNIKTKEEDEAVESLDIEVLPTPTDESDDTVEDEGEPKPKKPTRKYTNVHLEATVITEGPDSFMDLSADEERMVFVDNLPVDVTEMELYDLYSRCGVLERVQVFNQRPDLDPGPLTGQQLQKRKAQGRRNKQGASRHRWERPRTPVYGLLTFASPDGYEVAMDPNLHLFGMIVRKHAVRSVRSHDMTRLYIQNIPYGLQAADVEYQIGSCLKPDLYVSLDLGNNQRRKEPTHCEISFPSFAMAHASFPKVQEGIQKLVPSRTIYEDEAEESCSVQWMKTPKNAFQYWTRELGFD